LEAGGNFAASASTEDCYIANITLKGISPIAFSENHC
jgi:hypothetical protein